MTGNNNLSENADKAIQYICEREHRLGEYTKEEGSVIRAAQKILQEGNFDLEKLHADGDLRQILDTFL